MGQITTSYIDSHRSPETPAVKLGLLFFSLLEALFLQRQLCFFFVIRIALLFLVSHGVLFRMLVKHYTRGDCGMIMVLRVVVPQVRL